MKKIVSLVVSAMLVLSPTTFADSSLSGSTNVSDIDTVVGPWLVKSGIIVMWSGTIASIPTGWYLCNGSNGTPDLRDKFIVGATQDDTVAKTNITGSLSASGGSKDIVISGKETDNNTEIDSSDLGSNSNGTDPTNSHSHTINFTMSNANIPPYYALAYIMKS